MSKKVKQLLQAEIENRFSEDNVREFLVLSTIGIGGVDNNVMRGELKEKGIKLFIIRNLLAKKAFGKLDMTDAGVLLQGPCTVAYALEPAQTDEKHTPAASIVDIAREMVDWSKKLPVIEFKGAFLDGDVLDAASAFELSKMPTLSELQSKLVGMAMAPGANLASAVTAPASVIAGCLKTIIDKESEKEAA